MGRPHVADVSDTAGVSGPSSQRTKTRIAVLVTLFLAATGLLVLSTNDPDPILGEHRLFTRTTPDQVIIRVHAGDVRYQSNVCATDDGTDYSSCTKREFGLLIEFELPDGRSSTVAIPASEPEEDLIRLTSAGLGIPPGSADEMFTAVQVSDRVAQVRMELRDGGYDTMEPVDGFAVFATVSDQYEWRVEGLDASGAVVATG